MGQNPTIGVLEARPSSQDGGEKKLRTGSDSFTLVTSAGDAVRQENEAGDFPWDVDVQEGRCWCCGKALVRRMDGLGSQCVECWAGQVVYS